MGVGRGADDIGELGILEDEGYLIAGAVSGSEEDVLESLARENRLLLSDNENPMKQVLDRAGQGWRIGARTRCFLNVRGCEAIGYSIDTGDDYTMNVTIALVFGSENRAESAERRSDDILFPRSRTMKIPEIRTVAELTKSR